MALALHELVAPDDTIGPGQGFTQLLVLKAIDPSAGNVAGGGAEPGRLLTEIERAEIETRLSGVAPVRWIDPAKCQDCGACTGSCPTEAIVEG